MDNELKSVLLDKELENILDNVPVAEYVPPVKVKPPPKPRGRPMIPVEKCLKIYLDYQRGLRMHHTERKQAGLRLSDISKRYGVNHNTVSVIGKRQSQLHWERIRPYVLKLVQSGQADFLLQPKYAR